MTLDLLEQPTISVEEAAEVLGIGRGHAYELARRRELPGLLVLGSRYRVSTASLRRFLEGDEGAQQHPPNGSRE
jgi:excisionase family DNA binding protein